MSSTIHLITSINEKKKENKRKKNSNNFIPLPSRITNIADFPISLVKSRIRRK